MSVGASADNLDTQSCDGGSMCLELALEGERLCKAGDCRAGVAFFQAAIQAGTDDLKTLSAIYSQLGNAYFYLGDYSKAMQYHKHDLTLARTMNDKLGEAKASGNLGNTLKVMGKFSEAIQCCKRQLEISRSIGDKLSEGRALYNLGNVYHAQGKHLGRVGQNDPGHFPQEVRDSLMQAVTFYEENLELMRGVGDRQAMGRACGNLGNTCYLLGDFSRAIRYHTDRLRIAQEVGDKAAERRANSNLGNSHIFLGQFENAAEHYKQTLALAEELGDAAVEAQACYSLGNTYTLLREYRIAEEYHVRHLAAARKLQDRLGDVLGMATAQMNIGDLCKVLGLPIDTVPSPPNSGADTAPRMPFNALRVRRQSMEQLSLIQITPDSKKKDGGREGSLIRVESEENECPADLFMELIAKSQSHRMDEQRATLDKENRPQETAASNTENRLEDQRSELPRPKPKSTVPDDDFFTQLMKAQSGRLDDQRATIPLKDNRQNKNETLENK
ncbi:unnamed protein product [Leptidea sinapis]|uniref:MalT-like TPR region domain-containing protein n=1 Tax=Leptidea sinapis TaxID=189913 RepID=A0A5E4Q6D8_9NEOP|nr:unnamed protein product [Leptidea sinapis]